MEKVKGCQVNCYATKSDYHERKAYYDEAREEERLRALDESRRYEDYLNSVEGITEFFSYE